MSFFVLSLPLYFFSPTGGVLLADEPKVEALAASLGNPLFFFFSFLIETKANSLRLFPRISSI